MIDAGPDLPYRTLVQCQRPRALGAPRRARGIKIANLFIFVAVLFVSSPEDSSKLRSCQPCSPNYLILFKLICCLLHQAENSIEKCFIQGSNNAARRKQKPHDRGRCKNVAFN